MSPPAAAPVAAPIPVFAPAFAHAESKNIRRTAETSAFARPLRFEIAEQVMASPRFPGGRCARIRRHVTRPHRAGL
jgi:hypothetical protein